MSGNAAGLVVSPSVIIGYGTAIGDQESELTSIQGLLSAVYLTADSFGKLPEAGDLYRAYTGHASAVQQVMATVPGSIETIARELLATGQTYDELEKGMANGISNLFGAPRAAAYPHPAPPGTGGELTAGFATIISDSRSAYGWITSPEATLPSLGIQNLAPATSGWAGNFIQEAVDFVLTHLPGLTALLDAVTGDYAKLKQAAADWHTAGVRTLDVVGALKSSARELPETWAGAASAEFGRFMGGVTGALAELAGVMGQTQKILEDAAAEASFAQQTLSMIISEVIEWVAGNITLDILTAGLATGIEALASAGFIAEKIAEAEQAASKLASVYKALEKLLRSLAHMGKMEDAYADLKKAEGMGKLGKVWDLGKTFREALAVGKVANLRFLGDGKLAGAAVKAFDVAGRGLSEQQVKEVTDLGKDGMALRIGTNAALSVAGELTGLPPAAGLSGLRKDLITGTLKDLDKHAQGAAVTSGEEGPVPETPSVSRIAAMMNPDEHPPPEEH